MTKAHLFLGLLLCMPLIVRGEGTAERFQAANKAYENGDFAQAAKAYEALLSDGFESAGLHYNLGNACFRQGELGRAILQYEKALLLQPGDASILHNLEFARQRTVDKFEEVPDFFLRAWWHRLRNLAASGVWSFTGAFLWLAGFCALALWQLSRERRTRKASFFAGLALLLLSILPLSLALSRTAWEQHSGQAIISAGTASLRSAPDEAGTELYLLHEGTKLELLEKLGDWHKVQLPNGEEGWLPDGAFEEI
ncbi:MAG: tetratricopeptide repeat protein [Saprospiraceae bacterium]|nr:MAG: tetratricopeptide repeat protein [Saprospiraceae bacterium]